MKKIIILDFETGETHVFNFDSNIYDSINGEDDFFDNVNENYNLNLSINNCQWMVVETLNIQIH